MKLIIDIDKELKSAIYRCGLFLNPTEKVSLVDAINNGTPIPDNATNGDMIKAMFPNIDFVDFTITVHASTKVTSNGVKGGISYDFWKDWWNATYKAEIEPQESEEQE